MNRSHLSLKCSIHATSGTGGRMDRIIKPVKVVKRGRYYQLYYYSPDGLRRRLSVGSDERQAQRLAVKFTDWLLEGKDPEREMERTRMVEQQRSITLREFYPSFMEHHGIEVSDSMKESYKTSWNNACRCSNLVDVPIDSITRGLLLEYLNARKIEGRQNKCGKRLGELSNSTLNIEKAFISAMLSFAVEEGRLERNPLLGMKKFKVSPKRDIRITPEQIEELLKEMDKPRTTPNMLRLIRFAYYTGRRLEEIQSLRIENIAFHDLDNLSTYSVRVKGGEWKTFPASEEATEILKTAINRRKEGCVFINPRTGDRYKRSMTTLYKAVRKMGLKDESGKYIGFHCLRNIFASEFLDSGGRAEDAQELLGHSDIRVTQKYITRKPLSWSNLPKLKKLGDPKAKALDTAISKASSEGN